MFNFDWDEGNKDKNWIKHRVSMQECEEAFINRPIILFKDIKHSVSEDRYAILGKTNNKTGLTHLKNIIPDLTA